MSATSSRPGSRRSPPRFGVRLRSALPALQGLRACARAWLRGDVAAGVTLAACLQPSGLGDASLASLPPETGLSARPPRSCCCSAARRDRLRSEGVDEKRGRINRLRSVADAVEAFQADRT